MVAARLMQCGRNTTPSEKWLVSKEPSESRVEIPKAKPSEAGHVVVEEVQDCPLQGRLHSWLQDPSGYHRLQTQEALSIFCSIQS
jgi:hypothetical protein